MIVPSIRPQIDPADVPTEQLAKDKQLTEDQKLGEVTRQFEALLLRQILQDTQKTAIPSAFTDKSTASSIYQDMVTGQLADSISKSGTVGLAKMLQHQLSRQLHAVSEAGHNGTPEAKPTSLSRTAVTRPLIRSAHPESAIPHLRPLQGPLP